jgi:hypothetical protein
VEKRKKVVAHPKQLKLLPLAEIKKKVVQPRLLQRQPLAEKRKKLVAQQKPKFNQLSTALINYLIVRYNNMPDNFFIFVHRQLMPIRMKIFRTTVDIPTSERRIRLEHQILSTGSCFAQNMGDKLQRYCFDAVVNPFGVQYNPASIAKGIHRLISAKEFGENEFFQHGSLWNSFSHSSLFSRSGLMEIQQDVNRLFNKASKKLQDADYLFITPGTVWVYELAESSEIVSNCHKLPTSYFKRRRLSVDEIVEMFSSIFDILFKSNNHLCVIFTVSPVRHWKDGAHENNVSKAILHLAISELIGKYPQQTEYFPAYEIMMDELRDYRFYADDMIHPSALATEYIWECFSNQYFDSETKSLMKELEDYRRISEHRPIHAQTAATEKMKASMDMKRFSLIEQYPVLKGRL